MPAPPICYPALDDIQKAAAVLQRSEKPLLIFGQGKSLNFSEPDQRSNFLQGSNLILTIIVIM